MKKDETRRGEEKRLVAYAAAAGVVLASAPSADTTIISGWVDKDVNNGAYKVDIEEFGFIFEEDGYLGIMFPGSGNTDYGWIHIDATLEGYGSFQIQDWSYENYGDTIMAGNTETVPEPPTLALLAMGAAGVAHLRRRKMEQRRKIDCGCCGAG